MIGFYDYTVIATYLATVLGFCGIFQAMNGNSLAAVICLLIAGLLDSVDGCIARTKKNRSDDERRFGIQIDSLNDVICFGTLPAVLGYTLCRELRGTVPVWFTATVCFFGLAGLIRLAFFNVLEEERQKTEGGTARKYYLGVPITSSALVFPLLYLLSLVVPQAAVAIIAVGMLINGMLYIMPLQVPHAGPRGIIAMALIGAAEVAGLILL